jgi:hypothetical protein
LDFEKNANFFDENWPKSQKLMIITSTPGNPELLALSTDAYIQGLLAPLSLRKFGAIAISRVGKFLLLSQIRSEAVIKCSSTLIRSWADYVTRDDSHAALFESCPKPSELGHHASMLIYLMLTFYAIYLLGLFLRSKWGLFI